MPRELDQHERDHLRALLDGTTQPEPATCSLCMMLRHAGLLMWDDEASGYRVLEEAGRS